MPSSLLALVLAAACLALPIRAIALDNPAEQWRTTATVEVRVLDPSGASVDRAEVLVEAGGGSRAVAVSIEPGLYRVQLTTGSHLITVFKPGFQPVTHTITVSQAGSPLTVSVVLQPAGLTEQVTVTGASRFEGPAPTSGARMPIDALDLPQSVEAVPQAVLQTQAALSMQDALLNVTGVTPQLGEGRRDQVALRGFSAVNDSYIDGVRDDARYYRDLSNIETVEVVKGSASALYGRGSTGGLINRITKKPLFGQSVTELSVTAGSYDRRRVQGDLGRSFSNNQLAIRLTGAYEDTGSHRPFYSLERLALSPSVAWRSLRGTEVLVQADFLDDNRVPDRGIPSFEGRPVDAARDIYFGTPDDDFLANRVASQAVTVHQPLGRSWRLRNVFRHTFYDNEFSNTQPGTTRMVDGRLIAGRSQYNVDATQRNLFNQTELLTSGVLGPVAHTMLVGLEVGRESARTQRFTGTASDVDVLNPVLERPRYSPFPNTTDNRFTGNIAAAYVQEQVIVGRWRALVGGRFDQFDQLLDDLRPVNSDLSRVDRVFSPRAGIVYRTTAASSLYASYSRSFQPSGEGLSLAANTAELEPEDTLSYEVGAKSELFGDRLSVSAALFRLDRRNVKTRDPIDPNKLVLVGRQRSEGVELNAAGMIVRGWDIRGGVTFLDPVILQSNDVTSGVPVEGNRIGATATRNANLWSTYSVKQVTFGGGLFYMGDWFASNDNLVRLDGFTRVDAMAAYRLGRYEIALNLKNVLDAEYYESSNGNTQIMPAAGRNGLLSIRYRW